MIGPNRSHTNSLRSKSFKVDVDIDKVGFQKVEAMLNNLPRALKHTGQIGMIKAGKSFKRRLRSDIKSGGSKFGFNSGSNKYRDNKMSSGYADKQFNLTGAFYKSIILHWTKRGNVAVGVDKKAEAPRIVGHGGDNRKVAWYIDIVEKKYPLTKLSFRAWGGKNRIRSEVTKSLKISIAKFIKSGVVTRIT